MKEEKNREITQESQQEKDKQQTKEQDAKKPEQAKEKADEKKQEAKKPEQAKEKADEKKQEAKKPEQAKEKADEKKQEAKKPEQKKEKADEKKPKQTKKKRAGKGPLIGAAAVLLIVGGIYAGISGYYQTHFLPNTTINDMDCSGMNAAQAAELIAGRLQDYKLEITGRPASAAAESSTQSAESVSLGTITAQEISLRYEEDSYASALLLLDQQNIFSWPARLLGKTAQGISLQEAVTFDREMLAKEIGAWDACRKENMEAPQDAYISEYSKEQGGYAVVPATKGTLLDTDKLTEAAADAILAHETQLDADAAGCYETAKIDSDDAKLTKTVEEANKMLSAKITYDWNGTEVVLDTDTINGWVSIEDDAVVLDEEAVRAFVKEQAEEYDTYGKPRKFKTVLGIELTLKSYYGWQTDKNAEAEALIGLIKAGSVESREPIYGITAKNKGTNDIGSSYVEADLTSQHLYVIQKGEIVFETDFVSGNMSSTPDCVTPQGVFGLTYKTTNAVLRGRDYVTPVNYWMPFHGNYGMHDATWRSSFGGDIYLTSGSHGCINLPLGSAATIYEYVSTGSPIICYYYPADVIAVTPALNKPAPETPEEGNAEEAPAQTVEDTDDDTDDEE